MNVVIGLKEDWRLMTGLHTMVDVKCSDCAEIFGWKYERAYDESQKYKEGKFTLERFKIARGIGSLDMGGLFFLISHTVFGIHIEI
ncbi:hypothetical protein RND71_028459 [Anisodus tanguticus]|uniref:Protein yippee-like n=1 Tax=Anisodus tanguticus TaxID=243964 RepID=A0AAE1RKZ4_9SOLA|nr:hypothetical protein RND71_028459 [Anisodus tanguticus]